MVSKKSLGIGLENIWSRKKISVSVSKILVSKKSLGIGLDKIFWSRHSVVAKQGNFSEKRKYFLALLCRFFTEWLRGRTGKRSDCHVRSILPRQEMLTYCCRFLDHVCIKIKTWSNHYKSYNNSLFLPARTLHNVSSLHYRYLQLTSTIAQVKITKETVSQFYPALLINAHTALEILFW